MGFDTAAVGWGGVIEVSRSLTCRAGINNWAERGVGGWAGAEPILSTINIQYSLCAAAAPNSQFKGIPVKSS